MKLRDRIYFLNNNDVDTIGYRRPVFTAIRVGKFALGISFNRCDYNYYRMKSIVIMLLYWRMIIKLTESFGEKNA